MTNNQDQSAAISLRERKAARTRLGLMDAMLRRLRKQTFEEISVKELCADVDVSEPTFFNHFSSKHDLLVLYVRLWSVEMKQAMGMPKTTAYESLARLFSLTAQATERLPRLMQEIVSYQMRFPVPAKSATPTKAELMLRFPSLASAPASIRSLIETAIDIAVANRELPETTERDAVVSVLAALFFGVPALHGGSRLAEKTYLSGLRLIWRGLGGRA